MTAARHLLRTDLAGALTGTATAEADASCVMSQGHAPYATTLIPGEKTM
ncbi:hypothetical protein [Paraburkholderia flava]|nr:hypothetical protein [Paraburkholderia flava]